MLHSVTLWRSQLVQWFVETDEKDGAYLRHNPCGERLRILRSLGPGTEYSLELFPLVERVTGHRCPYRPSTTPQLVDGRESGSVTGFASLSGSSGSSPSPRPT